MKRDTHGMLHVESYYDLIGWQVINAYHAVGNDKPGVFMVISRDRHVHFASARHKVMTVFCPVRYMPSEVINYELKRRE